MNNKKSSAVEKRLTTNDVKTIIKDKMEKIQFKINSQVDSI